MRTVLLLHVTWNIIHSLGEKRIVDYEHVRSVFEDDPLVQDALAKEGSEWSLAPHDTECQYNHLRHECRHL